MTWEVSEAWKFWTTLVVLVVFFVGFPLWEGRRMRREMRKLDAEWERELALREKIREERARNIVIMGGYWHEDGHWQRVDIGEFAMRSPYQSVKDEFFRQTRRP